MKKALVTVALAQAVFILLLRLASLFGGALYYVVYALAFLLPASVALYVNRRELSPNRFIRLGKRAAILSIPLVPITIFLVVITSVFTTLILNYFGISEVVTLQGSLPVAIVIYALLPTFFEEIIFRYLPLRLMSHISARYTVMLSALLFAVAHLNPFHIAYAFVAGAMFMMLDIMADSVIPSMVIHFINNALSVVSFFLQDTPLFVAVYLPTLLVLSVIAGIFMFFMRGEYSRVFKEKLIFDNL